MTLFFNQFKRIFNSTAAVVLGIFLTLSTSTFAQANAKWRYATEKEEELILKGYIFYPPLKVRSPEEKQLLANKANAEKNAGIDKQEIEEGARPFVAEHKQVIAPVIEKKLTNARSYQEVESEVRIHGAEMSKSPSEDTSFDWSEQEAKQTPEEIIDGQATDDLVQRQANNALVEQSSSPPLSTLPIAIADTKTSIAITESFSSIKPKEPIPPTVTIKTPEISGQLSLGPNRSGLSIVDESYRIDTSFGVGYRTGSAKQAGAQIQASKLVSTDTAFGAYISQSPGLNDFVLSSVNSLSGDRILSKLSLGHMWGEQRFNFASGAAEAKLEQSSVVGSITFQVPKNSLGIDTIGGSLWAAKANQKSGLQPVYFETSSGGITSTYSDPRLLSEGSLRGGAISMALSPTAHFRLSPSLGTERVIYPFSNGTNESHEQLTASVRGELNLSGGEKVYGDYRKGVAERRSTLGLKSGNWDIEAFENEGLYGLVSNRGITVIYTMLDLFDHKSRPSQAHFISNPNKPSRDLLSIASQRPTEMPRTFLTKVDTTAVRLLSSRTGSITFTSPSGSQGVYFDSGAPNRTAINFTVAAAASDGSVTSYAWGSDPDNLQGALNLNTSTGVISGSHAAVATDKTYTFTIVATANGTTTTSSNLTLTIRAPVRVRFTKAGASVELGSANTTATTITFPSELQAIELLMVGGGGAGGGGDGGGGGGAGAVAYGSSVPITSGSYTVTIGSGGIGTFGRGLNGTATSLGALSAPGGGGGGMSNPDYEGLSGGSGGGGSQNYSGGAAGTECNSTIGSLQYYCYRGGGSTGVTIYGGSGGGGASSSGITATNSDGRNGGSGYTVVASLGAGLVAGGGGGGSDGFSAVKGVGGSAVGGNGGNNTTAPTAGSPNSGSGGGGGGVLAHTGGNGGDGLLILRY